MTAVRRAHGCAVEILSQIHQRQECAENPGLQVVGEVQAAGGHAGQLLAIFGDKSHDLPLSFMGGIPKRGFAAHL